MKNASRKIICIVWIALTIPGVLWAINVRYYCSKCRENYSTWIPSVMQCYECERVFDGDDLVFSKCEARTDKVIHTFCCPYCGQTLHTHSIDTRLIPITSPSNPYNPYTGCMSISPFPLDLFRFHFRGLLDQTEANINPSLKTEESVE